MTQEEVDRAIFEIGRSFGRARGALQARDYGTALDDLDNGMERLSALLGQVIIEPLGPTVDPREGSS